jgi:hypothetical protein
VWGTAVWDSSYWSGVTIILRSKRFFGRGNSFQFSLANSDDGYPLVFSSISLSGKEYGQKDIGAT